MCLAVSIMKKCLFWEKLTKNTRFPLRCASPKKHILLDLKALEKRLSAEPNRFDERIHLRFGNGAEVA